MGGAYDSVSPNNQPLAIITIKNLIITEATVQVDILNAVDGRAIVHAQDHVPSTNMDGVLFVANLGAQRFIGMSFRTVPGLASLPPWC